MAGPSRDPSSASGMTGFDTARRVLLDAVTARVFPAATVEVGASGGVMWRDAIGALTFDATAPHADIQTPFDLASLTKAIATTTVAMQLVADGTLRLDDAISTFFHEWRGADREQVTIRDLLEHASGLPARLVDPPPRGRREFEHDICAMPLEYAPRARSVYSDLGFILVGFLIADRAGASLAEQFTRIAVRLMPDPTDIGESPDADSRGVGRPAIAEGFGEARRRRQPDLVTFDLPADLRPLTAPTMPIDDDFRRGRVLAGEVHDPYAAALGGVAGHAGLFGTAPAVGVFARTVLRAAHGDAAPDPPFSPAIVARFLAKTSVPGSSRALGWDTMLPTSSCGTRMSARAFGHVGFTGTSLWIDPERDRYYVLLTNRAYGGGTLDQMRALRRAFHDALADQ